MDLGGLLSVLIGKGLHQNFGVIFFDGFGNGVDKIYIGIRRSGILAAISTFAVIAVTVVLVDAVNDAPVILAHTLTVFFNKSFKLLSKSLAGFRIAVTGAVGTADGGFVFGAFWECGNVFAESVAAVGRTVVHTQFAVTVAHRFFALHPEVSIIETGRAGRHFATDKSGLEAFIKFGQFPRRIFRYDFRIVGKKAAAQIFFDKLIHAPNGTAHVAVDNQFVAVGSNVPLFKLQVGRGFVPRRFPGAFAQINFQGCGRIVNAFPNHLSKIFVQIVAGNSFRLGGIRRQLDTSREHRTGSAAQHNSG